MNTVNTDPAGGGARRGNSGLTLIEVLASMIVLATGILAMAPLMTLSVTSSKFSNEVTQVASAVQREMEERVSAGAFPTMPYSEISMAGSGKYKIMTVVRDNTVDTSVPENVFEIIIKMVWIDDAGMDRILSFSTYAPKRK